MQFIKFSPFACDPSLLHTGVLGKEGNFQQGLNLSTESSVIHLLPHDSLNKCFQFTLSSTAKKQFQLDVQTLAYKFMRAQRHI